MKEKLVFVDHSFHHKTNATSFLIEILKKHFHVEIVWDEAWQGRPRTDLKHLMEQGFNNMILFQQISYRKKELRRIDGVNLVIIPMYDFSGSLSYRFWRKFKRVKIISFSKYLQKKLRKYRLISKYFQYFPKAFDSYNSPQTEGQLSGFFWQRTGSINWNHIRVLIKESEFRRFYIHTEIDPPGYTLILPSEEERRKYNITLTKWFPNREDYFKTLAETNVYFAPRIHEGIGMSFLEAMAMGKCVVAPNNPTMNEYIVHGETGLLYDPNDVKPLDFSKTKEIGTNAQSYIASEHKKWIEAEAELIDFINLPLEKDPHYVPPPWNVQFSLSIKGIIKDKFPRLARFLNKVRTHLINRKE